MESCSNTTLKRAPRRLAGAGLFCAPGAARWAQYQQGMSVAPECFALMAFLVCSVLPGSIPSRLRATFASDLLGKAAYERMERGYYERLLAPDRSLAALADSPLSTDRSKLPKAEDVFGEVSRVLDPVEDLRERVLKPSLTTRVGEASWSTNAFGLRDAPYEITKPPGTLRMILAGDSIAAGWGVDDGAEFESRLERNLDNLSRADGGPAVEILNLAAPGYSPGARWEHVRRLGWSLTPDLVIFEATLADFGWDERRIRWLLSWGIGWDSPQYHETLTAAGLKPGATAKTYQTQLKPYREALLSNVYRVAAAECRERGVPCVWLLLPRVGCPDDPGARRRLRGLAEAAGFSAIIDLSDTYAGIDPAALAVSPHDYHPNADGHARLARRLDAEFRRLPVWRRLTDATTREGETSP